jgi:vacuolar protein sorting-associated protein 54
VLQLPPPDFFTPYLDKVELALLDQVRNKSVAFFHETNRFAQLQEWITGLVQDVQLIRQLVADIREESVTHYEWIPWLDQQRQDFQQILLVLENANEVIRCKSSIGGLLSAQDDLGAAAQIQYGRQLLLDADVSRVQALSTVNDQLSQYETLVVNNLGEELVEVFLSWKEVNSALGSHSTWRTPTTSSEEADHLHQRVREIVHALQLCGALTKTSQTYVTRLTNVVRMTVRTTVGEYSPNGVGAMTLESFLECLNLLFEQLLGMLQSAVAVDNFCRQESLLLSDEIEHSQNGKSATAENGGDVNDSHELQPAPADQETAVKIEKPPTPTEEAVTAAADLMSKSISELLRMRKEAHSLVTLDEMKRLWDVCMNFTSQLEDLSDHRALGLRSTLSAQAKAFLERKHESNMSALVAALDAERWIQCEVSLRLCFRTM